MIPYVMTVEEAAAPHSSLAFIFWGEGLFLSADADLHGDQLSGIQGQGTCGISALRPLPAVRLKSNLGF
jgi:hypothetical protein